MPIKLKIKLYGTLSRSFDQYDHSSGLDVQLDGSPYVQDLLDYLGIDSKRVGMVVMDGMTVQPESELTNGSLIKILQPIAGG